MNIEELDEKYSKKLQTCNTGDLEQDHYRADEILCELLREIGLNKIENTYQEIEKWYA